MAYDIFNGTPRWNGKAIRGADAARFTVLAETIARDGENVYLGARPVKADAASFEVLSPTYAKDCNTVFYRGEMRLKPVSAADAASFVAVGDTFGRDARQGFFRDRRLRLSKAGDLARLAGLGHVYAHDGAVIYFTTKQVALPSGVSVDWSAARLRWLAGDDINLPPLIFFDGRICWYAYRHAGAASWVALPDADFETLAPVAGCSDGSYLHDARHVWFRDGSRIEGADAARADCFGTVTLRQGDRLWAGARPLDLKAGNAAFVMPYRSAARGGLKGDLIHAGDCLLIADPDRGAGEIARAKPERRTLDEIAAAALGPVMRRHFTILDHFTPGEIAPEDIDARMDDDLCARNGDTPIVWPFLPDHAIAINSRGEIELSLADGTRLCQPVSCWYTLSGHLWCHARGIDPEFMPFTAFTAMLPDGDEMQQMLIRHDRIAFWHLAGALFRAGHAAEATIMAHDLFDRQIRSLFYRQRNDGLVAELAGLPQALMAEFSFVPPRFALTSTTNLAAARQVIEENWLEAEDFRCRLDALGLLHGTMLATRHKGRFLDEIIPRVMTRYDDEALAHVRERMAFVLEAACIAGCSENAGGAASEREALRRLLEFCIARQIQTRLNRARLAVLA